MKVTRDVMNDLLPVYFSGEASEDTRTLVEEYFRENPEFERMARGAARPLDALRAVTTVAPEAEKEKRALKGVHKEIWRRKVMFGAALFLTLFPLAFVYSNGHFHWLLRENPWEAVVFWGLAAVLWLAHFRRLTQRAASLFIVMIFVPAPLLLDSRLRSAAGWRHFEPLWEAAFFWSFVILMLIRYFARLRRRTAMLLLAIYATLAPIPLVWYFARAHLGNKMAAPAVVWLAAAWVWWSYFRPRRKANADEDEC